MTTRKPRADQKGAKCAADCGWPLDPVLVAEGRTMHMACEFPDRFPKVKTRKASRAKTTRPRST